MVKTILLLKTTGVDELIARIFSVAIFVQAVSAALELTSTNGESSVFVNQVRSNQPQEHLLIIFVFDRASFMRF